MKRLDRYIGGLFAQGIFISLAACVGLFITIDLLDRMDRFAERAAGAAFLLISRYYFLQIPLFVHYLLPAAALMGAVAALAVLNRNAELMTLQGSGISVRRSVVGILAICLGLCAAAALNQEWLLPRLSKPLTAAEEMLKKTPETGRDPRFYNPEVFHDRAGRVFQLGAYDRSANIMENVAIYHRHEGRQTLVTARRGTFEGPGKGWRLWEGQIQEVEMDRPEIRHRPLGPEGWVIATEVAPETVLQKKLDPHLMGQKELKRELAEHKGIASLRVQYYNRLASPLSALVLVAAGVPIFLRRRSSNLATGVLMTIVTAGLFFYAQVLAATLGSQRLISPQAAAFLPPVLFLSGAGYAWTRIRT